ncbi:MAG: hypothetical protein L0221_17975, partial [Chloroflexi bacterium]|nr:hypothetical protein [Chloroflexota bacterium]
MPIATAPAMPMSPPPAPALADAPKLCEDSFSVCSSAAMPLVSAIALPASASSSDAVLRQELCDEMWRAFATLPTDMQKLLWALAHGDTYEMLSDVSDEPV